MKHEKVKCQRCGAIVPMGKVRCISCGYYNVNTNPTKIDNINDGSVLLSDVKSADLDRIDVAEWNMIFGGPNLSKENEEPIYGPGLVRDSVTIIGGLQGAGKSTAMLQLISRVTELVKEEGIYIATEESNPQIKARAERLHLKNMNRIRMISAMGGDADISAILMNRKPGIVVLDSLQGFVGEDQEAAVTLCKICKEFATNLNCPFIITQHVTKGLEIAGVNTIQHQVDTVMLFLPDDDEPEIRVLEVNPKNRFGRAYIKMYFIMTENGLQHIEHEESED